MFNAWLSAVSIQVYAALVTLVAVIVVVTGCVYLIRTSSAGKEDAHDSKERVYWIRGYYFWILSLVLLVALFGTLHYLPYERFQTAGGETVSVVGMQWAWKMSQGESTEKPSDFVGSSEITLPVGTAITFQVRSADVNHNFAIYNEQGTLLAETQAMPGYRNDLQYTFRKKGDYPILCLEYCGAPHTIMTGKIHIE